MVMVMVMAMAMAMAMVMAMVMVMYACMYVYVTMSGFTARIGSDDFQSRHAIAPIRWWLGEAHEQEPHFTSERQSHADVNHRAGVFVQETHSQTSQQTSSKQEVHRCHLSSSKDNPCVTCDFAISLFLQMPPGLSSNHSSRMLSMLES